MKIKVLKCTNTVTDYNNLIGQEFDIIDEDILRQTSEMSFDGKRKVNGFLIDDSFFIPNGHVEIYFINISDTNYKQALRKQKLNEIQTKKILP